MIYFIRCGRHVKIGYCARDPIRRLERLQTGNPAKLRLIGLTDGEPADERAWHLRFHRIRARGEWFKISPELLAAIEPHAVDHAEVSRNRPERTINGMPAHLLPDLIAAVAEFELRQDATLSSENSHD